MCIWICLSVCEKGLKYTLEFIAQFPEKDVEGSAVKTKNNICFKCLK